MERSRFVAAVPQGNASLWAPAESIGGDGRPLASAGGPARQSGRLTSYLTGWLATPEHRWALAVYPFLLLLDFYRVRGQGQPEAVPTKTYTLF